MKLFKISFGLVFWMIYNMLNNLDKLLGKIPQNSVIEQNYEILTPEYNKIKEAFFDRNLFSYKLPTIFGLEDGFQNGLQAGIKETYMNAYNQGFQQKQIDELQKELKIKKKAKRKEERHREEKQRQEKEKHEEETRIAIQRYDEEIRKRSENSDDWWKI